MKITKIARSEPATAFTIEGFDVNAYDYDGEEILPDFEVVYNFDADESAINAYQVADIEFANDLAYRGGDGRPVIHRKGEIPTVEFIMEIMNDSNPQTAARNFEDKVLESAQGDLERKVFERNF